MRSMMVAVLLLGAMACGCAPQEQAQRALIGGMQQGLAQVEAWQQKRQELVDGFYAQQRRGLDDAFDADVRQAPVIEPQWVIEARQAYAAGIEAIYAARQASADSQRQAQENLAAVREGLDRLAWLSELRQNWASTFEQAKKEVKR